jgi:hypothetical protein
VAGQYSPLDSHTINSYTQLSQIRLGFGLDDRGSILSRAGDGISFSSPPRPDQLCDPPSLLSNGYRG